MVLKGGFMVGRYSVSYIFSNCPEITIQLLRGKHGHPQLFICSGRHGHCQLFATKNILQYCHLTTLCTIPV